MVPVGNRAGPVVGQPYHKNNSCSSVSIVNFEQVNAGFYFSTSGSTTGQKYAILGQNFPIFKIMCNCMYNSL